MVNSVTLVTGHYRLFLTFFPRWYSIIHVSQLPFLWKCSLNKGGLACKLFAMYQLRNIAAMEMIIHAVISTYLYSHFPYNFWSELLNSPKTFCSYHVTSFLIPLYWRPIKCKIFKFLKDTFQTLHEQAHSYMKQLLQPYHMNWDLKSSHLVASHSSRKTEGDCVGWNCRS